MPTISIIIPIYNSEKYLRRCLDSIKAQTFKDFEAILIDDGSTDSSGRICDEYASEDARFVVFHKPNGGVSSARNLALEMMQGEWVTFVDSDDLLEERGLEIYISHIADDIDCVAASYVKTDDNLNVLKSPKCQIQRVINYEEALIDFYKPIVSRHLNFYIWTRLFRSSIIKSNKLRFNEKIYIKEDGLFIVDFICQSKRSVYFTTEPVYIYIQHEESAMNKLEHEYSPKYITDLDACILCYKRIKNVSKNPALLYISNRYTYRTFKRIKIHYKTHKVKSLKTWFILYRKAIQGISLIQSLKSIIKK